MKNNREDALSILRVLLKVGFDPVASEIDDVVSVLNQHDDQIKSRVCARLAEMTKESQGLSIYQENLLFQAIDGVNP